MNIMKLNEVSEFARSTRQFENMPFVAHFPNGPVQCMLLDAYFGLFIADGIDGVLVVNRVSETFTIQCEVTHVQ